MPVPDITALNTVVWRRCGNWQRAYLNGNVDARIELRVNDADQPVRVGFELGYEGLPLPLGGYWPDLASAKHDVEQAILRAADDLFDIDDRVQGYRDGPFMTNESVCSDKRLSIAAYEREFGPVPGSADAIAA